MLQSRPTLTFFDDIEHDFIFDADFISNSGKMKVPSGTTHHLCQGDFIRMESSMFNRCKAILKYKSNPDDIDVVETNFYNILQNQNKNAKYTCRLQIPKSGAKTRVSGLSPSRVGYINIIDGNGKLICQSNSFWIRSRSRCQIEKDTNNKKRFIHQIDSPSLMSSVEITNFVSSKKTKVFSHAYPENSTSTTMMNPANISPIPTIYSSLPLLPSIDKMFTDKDIPSKYHENISEKPEIKMNVQILTDLIEKYKNQCDDMVKILDEHKKILDSNATMIANIVAQMNSSDIEKL